MIFSNLPNRPTNAQKNFGMSGFWGEFALGTHFGSVLLAAHIYRHQGGQPAAVYSQANSNSN